MRRLFSPILLFAIAVIACNRPVKNIHRDPHKPEDYQVKIKIPDEWIEKVRRFDYSKNTKQLLKEFEGFIKPDTLIASNAAHVDTGYGRMIAPVFVDLDSENGDELICILGRGDYDPSLCVFKQQDGDWYLIYLEEIHTFYSAPVISIANNFSRNKTFYYRQVDGHGSGVYFDSYTFYKLIDNKVYKCLKLANEERDYGDKLYMSREIKMNFEFSGSEADLINAGYTYNLFTGGVDSLIMGDINVDYKWDNSSKEYKIDIAPFQRDEDKLIDKKINFFNSSGDDSLLVSAFRNRIDELLKIGTSQQKKALNNYLEALRKEQTSQSKINH